MLRSSWAAVLALAGAPLAGAAEPSFRDVAALLSKAGCNQGACHGNLNGKGGFKLSLRGDDPAFDHTALSRDQFGRRANPFRPDESLLLRKPAMLVPHEGGRRFLPDSPEYAMIRDWIAAGMPTDPPEAPALTKLTVTPAEQVVVAPADRVRLQVTATFADGSTRDVTRLACYDLSSVSVASIDADGDVTKEQDGETTVQVRYLNQQTAARLAFVPARPDFRWPDLPEKNFIDTQVFAKLKTLRMRPADPADDATFLRRVYLDTLGTLPTADEARGFLADSDPDKRAKLIERLVERPEFADFWALKWSDLFRNEEKVLDAKGVRVFHAWVREQMAANVPLNEFARRVIAARGSTYAQPEANYYRALRDTYDRGEATAQVFLGVRVQCARCHNHPFDRWTQNDYHEWSAFFARVQYRIVENQRKDRFDKHEFVGEQVVWQDRTAELRHPRTKEPFAPKFLGDPKPADLPKDADRLQALADWVADPANPFFARAQANRVWYHLFGRGLVEPNDDFRASNPAAHPALLEELARHFAIHNFDLRYLVKFILNSQTYQLSWVPDETNRGDVANFAKALVQPLKAEQMLDALGRALEAPVKFDGYPTGTLAGQLPDLQMAARRGGAREPTGARFLKAFGKPDRLLSCECERTDDTTVVQAFQLMTGGVLHQMLTAPDNRIGRLLKVDKSDAEIVEELYLAALARLPTDAEREAATTYVAKAKDRRAGLEDVAWGLVNAKEFLLRR
jgi:hypothetical protein